MASKELSLLFLSLVSHFLTFDLHGGTGHLARVP